MSDTIKDLTLAMETIPATVNSAHQLLKDLTVLAKKVEFRQKQLKKGLSEQINAGGRKVAGESGKHYIVLDGIALISIERVTKSWKDISSELRALLPPAKKPMFDEVVQRHITTSLSDRFAEADTIKDIAGAY